MQAIMSSEDQLCLSLIAVYRMSKVLPKDGSPLKFDTSPGKLDCFIHTSTPPRCPSDATAPKTRNRPPLTPQPRLEFQDKAFLESVLCKILNDADCEGLTDLIDSMVFPASTPADIDAARESHCEAGEQDEISKVFSDFQSFNKSSSSPHAHVFAPSCDPYCPAEGSFVCGALDSRAVSPRPQEGEGYGYGYLSGNYPYRQPSQRKRRGEGQEFKISAEKMEADGRTTLMIRHIPNKYSEEMLWEEIARNHRLRINFLYLPVDHYNACNVGYAFVNFVHAKFIREFYREFNGRRWDRFNSEKICELAYARVQGATNLIDHFHATQRGRRGTPGEGTADGGEEARAHLHHAAS